VRRVLGTVACALLLTSMAGTPVAADTAGGGGQRWTVGYLQGAPAYATGVVTSPTGQSVFVTGDSSAGQGGRMATVAYDATSGEQQWAATYPAVDDGTFARPHEVATTPDGSVLLVSGFVSCGRGCDGTKFEGFATIAYDAATGAELWASRFAATGGLVNGLAVSPDGSTVVINESDGLEGTATVAYDATNGDELWQVTGSKAIAYYGGGLAISPDGSTVYVTDTAPTDEGPCYSSGGYLTRAYDVTDGSLRWSTTAPVADAFHCGTPTDLALSADGTSLVVTGYASTAGPQGLYGSGTVAFDTATGAPLWTVADNSILVVPGDTYISLGLSPDGSQVFVSGDDCADHPDCDFATMSLDTATGERQWLSGYDGGGRGYEQDLAVSPDGSSVFITGQESLPCYSDCVFSGVNAPLVAYDAQSGDERWATVYPENYGQALAVSPDSASVYLVGSFATSTASARTGAGARARACSDHCGYATTRYNTGPGAGTVEDSATSMGYAGWRGSYDEHAVGGAYRASREAGASASFRTPRTARVSWLTQQGPDQGRARLFVDGKARGTYDLYDATRSAREVTITGLDRTRHTLRVQVLGTRNAASSNTWVAVDGFGYRAEDGLTQESEPDIRYDAWTGHTRRAASGGSFRASGSRGSSVSLDFRGRSIRWITATGGSFGRARVVIDGTPHRVDLFRRTTTWRVPVTFRGLGRGEHHLTIRPLGSKARGSSSTRVVVDALVVRR
jgi:hypothetical protein